LYVVILILVKYNCLRIRNRLEGVSMDRKKKSMRLSSRVKKKVFITYCLIFQVDRLHYTYLTIYPLCMPIMHTYVYVWLSMYAWLDIRGFIHWSMACSVLLKLEDHSPPSPKNTSIQEADNWYICLEQKIVEILLAYKLPHSLLWKLFLHCLSQPSG